MSLWSKIVGTIESYFQIGLGGPRVKANSGAIDMRNAADNAYVITRGLSPVGMNDYVTKQYADTLATRYVVSGQFDGNNALPSNTGTEQFLVVTTTGANASIGDLIFDDGSSTGTATKIVATSRTILSQTALTGGTVSLAADTMYWWDTGVPAWTNISGSTMSGALRTIRMAITNAASQSSASTIPANANIRRAMLDVVTPYSGGATISVGRTGSLALMMATTDSLVTAAGLYEVTQDTAFGASALAVVVTVAGTPAAGAGYCIVEYTVPDA